MSALTPRFSNERLSHYPHMFPLDIEIWERFLDKHGSIYTGFDYDVKVGLGAPPLPDMSENFARMQDTLSKFRIDVVGYDSSFIYIIEVKPEASTVAIGQIVSYLNLYERDFSPTLPLRGVIVTDRELPDIRYLTSEYNIDYYVV